MPRGREYQNKYAKSHGSNGEARHIVPAKNINKYTTKNNDHIDNYRMGSTKQNTDDRRIDNMVERGVYRTHGLSGGSYLHPDRIADRISQQVVSYKMMDNYSRIELQNLYRAANHYNMDLRIFNGLQFYRGY